MAELVFHTGPMDCGKSTLALQLDYTQSTHGRQGRVFTSQDRAGEAFAHLGIVRGERRAEARRQAKAEGREPEPKRGHVPPRRWRQQMAEKEARLEKQAEELLEAATKVSLSAAVVRSASLTAEERAKVDGARATLKEAAILANRVKAGDRARDEARRIAIAKNARAAQARKGKGGQGQGWDR